jgi:hypothetical protein
MVVTKYKQYFPHIIPIKHAIKMVPSDHIQNMRNVKALQNFEVYTGNKFILKYYVLTAVHTTMVCYNCLKQWSDIVSLQLTPHYVIICPNSANYEQFFRFL